MEIKTPPSEKAFKPANNAAGGSVGIFSRTINGQKLISCDATNASILDLVKRCFPGNGKELFLIF